MLVLDISEATQIFFPTFYCQRMLQFLWLVFKPSIHEPRVNIARHVKEGTIMTNTLVNVFHVIVMDILTIVMWTLVFVIALITL